MEVSDMQLVFQTLAQDERGATAIEYGWDTERRVRLALSSGKRVDLLEWLINPEDYFPVTNAFAMTPDGVPMLAIVEKWNLAQRTSLQHLNILAAADLVHVSGAGRARFYRRNEKQIRRARDEFGILYIPMPRDIDTPSICT
jgi:DNA-binding transcriptional ArsR family regulator